MNLLYRYLLTKANFVFLLTLGIVLFMPSARDLDTPIPLLVVLISAEIVYMISYWRKGKKSATDIATFIFLFLGIWDFVCKLGITHPVLIPPPENVFYVFVSQRTQMVTGLYSSLSLLFWGFTISLTCGIFLGLVVGWVPRLRDGIYPIAKVISPIPPLVYTPYVVALMPSFRLASIFVIFSGIFWPTFMQMVNRVGGMDHKLIETAKGMAVSTPTMLFHVILPYTLPGIVNNLSLSLATSFMCLTGAELLGATAGLGYFVKRYSDYADYTKVLAGIIFIGLVVTLLNLLVQLIERKTIKWHY